MLRRLLQQHGILQLEARGDGEVAVDDGELRVIERARQVRRIQRQQLDLLGVLGQIELRHAQRIHAGLELDQTRLLQQQQAAREVARIIGQRHLVALFQIGQRFALLAVHPHRCDRALHQRRQIKLAVALELVEIYLVLEEIGVQRAIGQCQIGLHIVIELHQLDLVALFLQQRHDAGLQLVDVRARRAADHQLFLGGILRQRRACQTHGCRCQHGGSDQRAAGGEKGRHVYYAPGAAHLVMGWEWGTVSAQRLTIPTNNFSHSYTDRA
ncbi:hypothetical protein D3C72_1153080 [compost metagenome]